MHDLLLSAGAFGTQGTGQYHLADIDNDKDADLLFIGNAGDVHVRLSDGTGLPTQLNMFNTGYFWNLDNSLFQ